jgi:hypothetical protein
MKSARVHLAAAAFAAALSSFAPAYARATPSPPSSAHDFDFLIGEWNVHHRRLKPGTHEWVEFEGTCSNRALMEGSANVEEHALDAPAGAYRAVGLRAYDSKGGQWAIWWLDGRFPHGPLDPPVKGRFEQGVGAFYSDYVQGGKSMRGRFLWSGITPTSARWEQASSSDAGKTWETNWIMEFRRAQRAPSATQSDVRASWVRDFDFLRGEWHVRHRFLRAATHDWAEADGTCSNRPLMDGRANLEEHWMNAPAGAYRALGLRSYDPKTARWAIWWLDGRTPHADLDPPVRGRFENGTGIFYGDEAIDGKPMPVRFVWSQITATSARWEQAYSPDAGKTWETNWIMEFRRAP